MKANTFRKSLNLYVFIFILIILKTFIYPYSLAPEELAKAISLYDETQPFMSGFEALFVVSIIVLLIISIFKLYFWKSNGRLLFLIAVIGLNFSIFINGYYVFDALEYLLDGLFGILSGFILCSIYYTDLKKKFK